jgi:hypothetical protein
MTKSRGRVARRPGPYSERISFGYVLDRRTSEGKFVLAIREQLTRHLGGQLTAPQQLIVSAASIKALRLEMMLKTILSEEAIASGNQDGQYLAWSNSLRRDLEAIGIARPPELPRLGDYLKAIDNPPAAAPEEDADRGEDDEENAGGDSRPRRPRPVLLARIG